MKRITALLLVLVMIVPLALMSCDKDDGGTLPPAGGTGTNAPQGGGETQGDQPAGTDQQPADTQAPVTQDTYIYVPDTEAKYSGLFGIGTHGSANIEFDDIKVTNRADKFEMVTNDFSGENPMDGWTTPTGTITVAEETKAPAETEEGEETEAPETDAADEEKNMVAAASGDTMAYFGDPSWNFVQFSVKIKAIEIGDGVSIYAAVKDDQNYVEVVIGEDGGKYISAYTVVNGEKTLWGSKFPYDLLPLDAEEFQSCSVTLNKEMINVYVNGSHLFDVYSEEAAGGLYGGVGFGTWLTTNSYDNVKVTAKDGTILYENDFSNAGSLESDFVPKTYSGGGWSGMEDNWLSDFVIEADEDAAHGNVLKCVDNSISGAGVIIASSIGNEEWANYTLDCDMRIDGSAEGWLVWSAIRDDSNYAMYNIGGWSNSQTCFEPTEGGAKSTQTQVAYKYTLGVWYHLTLEVTDMYVRGHIYDSEGTEIITNTYLKTLA